MRKLLDIELKNVIRFNFNPPMCVYDNIAAVTNYLNIQSELMFINVLDFNSKIHIVGDKVEIAEQKADMKFKLLNEYYGLIIKNNVIENFDDFIGVLKAEITKGYPLMVGFDSYLCPWDPAYQKDHIEHICLLSGFDEEEQRLYFTDPFHWKKDTSVSIEEYSKAYSKYYTFEMIEKDKADTNNIFKEKINWIKENAENRFLEFLSAAEGIVKNIEIYDKNSVKDFYYQFKEVILREAYNFTCFTNLILYLKQSNSKYAIILTQFERLFSHMMALYALFWKGIVSGNMDKLANLISIRIKEISDLYSKNLSDIIKICNSGIVQYIDNRIDYKPQMTTEGNNCYIDLFECFNNKGIGENLNHANLTGFSEHFLKDEALDSGYLEAEHMKFQIPKISKSNRDNIMCNLQNLEIGDSVVYQTLNILGCSEFGPNQGKIKIIYENGESSEEFIKFADFYMWDNAMPENSVMIWTGKAAFVNAGQSEEMAGTAYLYSNSFTLKNYPIANIILPDAPYLHMFAMTLVTKIIN